jgi:hypothetical protein
VSLWSRLVSLFRRQRQSCAMRPDDILGESTRDRRLVTFTLDVKDLVRVLRVGSGRTAHLAIAGMPDDAVLAAWSTTGGYLFVTVWTHQLAWTDEFRQRNGNEANLALAISKGRP